MGAARALMAAVVATAVAVPQEVERDASCIAVASSSTRSSWVESYGAEPCRANEQLVPTFQCVRGHNRPPSFCQATQAQLWPPEGASNWWNVRSAAAAPPTEREFEGHAVVRQWNLTMSSQGGGGAALNSLSASRDPDLAYCVKAPTFWVVIPFHSRVDGGVNYYHYHVDVLLPLYLAMRRAGAVPKKAAPRMAANALLIPTVSNLQWQDEDFGGGSGDNGGGEGEGETPAVDWHTNAFDDHRKFWVRSLQAMTDLDLLPYSSSGLGNMVVERATPNGGGVSEAENGGRKRSTDGAGGNRGEISVERASVTFSKVSFKCSSLRLKTIADKHPFCSCVRHLPTLNPTTITCAPHFNSL